MITLSDISLHFGGTQLFDGISLSIGDREKIALIGHNGAGKSTLLKVIYGLHKNFTGNVAIPKGETIGYLAQHLDAVEGLTVKERAAQAFLEALEVEQRITSIEGQLTNPDISDYEELVEELVSLTERLSVIKSADQDQRIEQILKGLGFSEQMFDMPMAELSGGWKMRVELAKLLLQRPNLLLLDEPTNHLDIVSIQWLEKFLLDYSGSFVLISHDKLFLDNVTNRTVEIKYGKIKDAKLNYTAYLERAEEEKLRNNKAFVQQQKQIEHTQELINKFRAKKNKAAFAQSLIKKLDKMDRLELDDDALRSIRLRFPPAPRSGKVVLEVEGLGKRYDKDPVLENVDLMIGRGEKIALVGKNGIGKSTLLKTLIGKESHEGNVSLGHNVELGYFAQDSPEKLDPKKTVFETIDDQAVGDVRKQVRSILGSFLFSGEDADKRVSVLSGGEKTRLALCQLLLSAKNLLVLDEPTNHLDIQAKEVLKNALLDYDGTLIIVSHDRDLLHGLTDRVYQIVDGGIKIHHGDLYEHLHKFLEGPLENTSKKQSAPPSEKKKNHQKKRANEKKAKKLKSSISKLEGTIDQLEKRIALLEKEMADMDQTDPDKLQGALAGYEELKRQLGEAMKEWEAKSDELSAYDD